MKKQGHYNFFLLCIKQLIIKKREVILNRAKKYYHENIEVLREKARNKYSGLSEEGKSRKREYGRDRYHRKLEEARQES